MKYSFDRVRYSEIGEDKSLTLNSVINYFQDCSTFHFRNSRGRNGLSSGKTEGMGPFCMADNRGRYPMLCEKIRSIHLAL